MMFTHLIYKHTNTKNNKCYIGQTVQVKDPEKRWQKGNGYVNQPKFYRAISKYGWEAFNHEILEYCISAEHANLREQYYIAKFDSINYGYNTSLGGSIPQHFQKAIYQLDANKNILAIYESTRQAERITGISQANISHCCLGIVNSANGFYWCHVEDYDNYQIKSIGLSKGQPKRVLQYTKDGKFVAEFNSCSEAERLTGIKHQNISKCCTGKLPQTGGFIWRYIDNEKRTSAS